MTRRMSQVRNAMLGGAAALLALAGPAAAAGPTTPPPPKPAAAPSAKPAGPTVAPKPAVAPDPRQSVLFKCPRVDAGEIEGEYLTTPVHQGYSGWFFREGSDLEQFFEYGSDLVDFMKRYTQALAEHGVKLVYLPVPPKALLQPERLGPAVKIPVQYSPDLARADFEANLDQWRQQGVIVVDMLKQRPEKVDVDLFFGRDHHWTPLGAKLGAEAVRQAIEQDPGYEEVSKKAFVTKDLGVLAPPPHSAMQQALQRMCTDQLPQEKVDEFVTNSDGASASDLLGDEETPVALIGTSFSDLEAFNFAGFLQEKLSLEVANYAISGGGPFTSMLSYTHSEALENSPPKYLIWENPAYDRLDGEGVTAFRRLIPAVHGFCEGDQMLSEDEVAVPTKGSGTLPIETTEAVVGHKYYLAMKASDQTVRNMTVAIDYPDGDQEIFAIALTDREKLTDRFFLEFSDDFPTPVKSVTFSGQPDRDITLDVKLCKAPEDLK